MRIAATLAVLAVALSAPAARAAPDDPMAAFAFYVWQRGTSETTVDIGSSCGKWPSTWAAGLAATIYQAADLLAVPSRSEGGLVLVGQEALVCGTPVLLGNDPDLMKRYHQCRGLFFSSFDAEAIRLKIMEILASIRGETEIDWGERPFESFLPDEDQGYMYTQMSLPVGSTKERSIAVMNQIEKHYLETEKDNIRSVFSVIGFSFSGRGQNNGIAFVSLKDWSERTHSGQDVQSVAKRAMGTFSKIKEAMVFPFVPPAITQLGTSTGFNLQLQDLGGIGHDAMIEARNQFLGMASKDARLVNVRPNGQDDTPQFKLDVNQEKAAALGVSLSDINSIFNTAWAASYVNDFIDRGRVKKVFVQGDAQFRMLPEDVSNWYARNNKGEMVPFSAFTTGRWIFGSPRLERYNGVASININGQGAPGVSSGDAMLAVEEIIKKLPAGVGYQWTGMSFQERQSGNQAPMLYAVSILVVFLCLAALYESWSVPFAVMLVVPLGVLGAVLFAIGRGLSNDVYFQVGLLTTIGLASKNAILIVEFAKSLHEQGMSLFDATMDAVRMRLRPIIMTSLAFMLGVTPLVIAHGAGSGSQNAIGTGVFGGMLSATVLAIFFVPVFFVVVFQLAQRWFPKKHDG